LRKKRIDGLVGLKGLNGGKSDGRRVWRQDQHGRRFDSHKVTLGIRFLLTIRGVYEGTPMKGDVEEKKRDTNHTEKKRSGIQSPFEGWVCQKATRDQGAPFGRSSKLVGKQS